VLEHRLSERFIASARILAVRQFRQQIICQTWLSCGVVLNRLPSSPWAALKYFSYIFNSLEICCFQLANLFLSEMVQGAKFAGDDKFYPLIKIEQH